MKIREMHLTQDEVDVLQSPGNASVIMSDTILRHAESEAAAHGEQIMIVANGRKLCIVGGDNA